MARHTDYPTMWPSFSRLAVRHFGIESPLGCLKLAAAEDGGQFTIQFVRPDQGIWAVRYVRNEFECGNQSTDLELSILTVALRVKARTDVHALVDLDEEDAKWAGRYCRDCDAWYSKQEPHNCEEDE